MNRDPIELTLTIADGASESDVAHVAGYTMFTVRAAADTEGTHLQFREDYGDSGEDSYDEDGNLKIMTFTAEKWKDAPVECCTMHRMRIKTCSAVDGTAQAQTGETTIVVRCKS